MQGARCGTRSLVSRIRPWAEGGAKPLSHPGCPCLFDYSHELYVKWDPVVGVVFFFKIFIYLFMRHTHTHTHTQRQRQRHREKQAPCREPDVGLDPGSPGLHPGLQAAPNRCATGAAQILLNFNVTLMILQIQALLVNY